GACGDFASWGKVGGQVLQRMDGEIDAAGGEGFFNLFGEDSFAQPALGADHREGDVGDFVAGGVDDFDFDLVASGAQQGRDMVGLPQGELGTGGPEGGGG